VVDEHAPDQPRRQLRHFDFATRRIRPILEVDKDFSRGLSVSPDGLWIAGVDLQKIDAVRRIMEMEERMPDYSVSFHLVSPIAAMPGPVIPSKKAHPTPM
jgi:hypothetical protein